MSGNSRRAIGLALQEGRAGEAERLALDWLETSPDDRGVRQILAAALLEQQRFDDAAEAALALTAAAPEDTDAAVLLVRTLYRGERYDEARQAVARGLSQDPGDARLLQLLRAVDEALDRRALFASLPYLAAYRTWMDRSVRRDPQAAVGSLWEELGQLQFDYLCASGLSPSDRLLDLGCGTLRAGRHFIRWLEPGHYAGLEMSGAALDHARRLVAEEGLSDRAPLLVQNPSGALDFAELDGRRFDAVLAQSVFTHLHEDHFEQCFAHLDGVLAEGGRFFFTFNEAAETERWSEKDFAYPFALFSDIAGAHGFAVERRGDYRHPRGQVMAIAARR